MNVILHITLLVVVGIATAVITAFIASRFYNEKISLMIQVLGVLIYSIWIHTL